MMSKFEIKVWLFLVSLAFVFVTATLFIFQANTTEKMKACVSSGKDWAHMRGDNYECRSVPLQNKVG